jgi:ribosomal protein S18 acetylase RimI-like enzyme
LVLVRKVRIVRVDEDAWRVVSQVRLRALRENPEAFGSGLERELLFAEPHWRMRLRGTPTWLAIDEVGVARGMISLIQEPGSPVDDRHVVGLWVAPESRRRGIAWALLDAARTEALAGGARTMSLWVLDDNTAAGDLYVRAGFSRTGTRQPLPRDDSKVEERYELRLPPPSEA